MPRKTGTSGGVCCAGSGASMRPRPDAAENSVDTMIAAAQYGELQ